MALLLDSPSKLLRRVQEFEDAELPSLPSFQPDLDSYGDDYYGGQRSETISDGDELSREESLPSPYFSRGGATPSSQATIIPKGRSPPSTQSTVVPRSRTPLDGPTPLANRGYNISRQDSETASPGAYTSTPYSEQLRASSSTHRSSTKGSLRGSQQNSSSQQWDATAESLPKPSMMYDQSIDDLSESSLPTASSFTSDPSMLDTPIPRGRGQVAISVSHRYDSLPRGVNLPDTRIPSLSRSEVSGTDNEATTPDGPDRFKELSNVSLEEQATQEYATRDYNTQEYATRDYNTQEYHTTLASVGPISEMTDLDSPAKSSLVSSAAATPAPVRYMDVPTSEARAAATPFPGIRPGPLREVTPAQRNRDTYTPSPAKSPASEYATPRATLNDAERRKSHVLTVLASSALPTRFRKRGTPYPARRVSIAPDTGSIVEEGDSSRLSVSRRQADDSTASPNQSFVSIASSQDLTIDRRGSRLLGQRGNTSVPDILLGNAATSPAIGGMQSRADAIKIGKHVNTMNQELLQTNIELAREAEAWQSECELLRDLLDQAGIQLDEEGNVIGDLPKQKEDASLRQSASASVLQDEIRRKEEIIADLESRLEAKATDNDGSALQQQLEESREAHKALQAEFAQRTQDHATQFAEICGDYEEELKQLRADRDAATQEIASLREADGTPDREVEDALRTQVTQLEDDLEHALDEVASLKTQLGDLEHDKDDLLDQLQSAKADLSDLQEKLNEERSSGRSDAALHEELAKANSAKSLAITEVEATNIRLTDLQRQLTEARDHVEQQRESLEDLQQQVEQREADKIALQRQASDIEEELQDARATIIKRETDIASLNTKLQIAEMDMEPEKSIRSDPGNNTIVLALEDRLDDAHREIGRLKHELDAAPARQSKIDSLEARVRAIEGEKLALQERLRSRVGSPATWSNSMKSSTPIVNRVLANLRTPATPGPMKEFSWLQTTIGDSNESMLRAQLEHLQQELEVANSQLDRNFNRLEEAGLSSVQLAEKLAAAKDRVAELEEQLRQMARDNKQSLASLNLGRDKNERLESALDSVQGQMDKLKADMHAEKERLHDETRRLRVALSDVQVKADDEIEELGVEMARIRREADDRVGEAEEQLQTLRADKDSLTSNLRTSRVTIERLERDIRKLQQTNEEVTRHSRRLQDNQAATSQQEEAMRSLRNKLRDAETESGKLRDELSQRSRSLDAAEKRVDDLKAERARVTRELMVFSADLATQRKECSKFGTELEALRLQGDNKVAQAKAAASQFEAELQWAQDRLQSVTREAKEAEKKYAEMERRATASETQTRDTSQEARQKYKTQTRRLAAQIEYLKALYTRESTFRHALALQKKFLLLLVGGLSLNEQATLRAIASMGFPQPPPPRPKRTLKAVGIAVISIIRARRMADEWRVTESSRPRRS